MKYEGITRKNVFFFLNHLYLFVALWFSSGLNRMGKLGSYRGCHFSSQGILRLQ